MSELAQLSISIGDAGGSLQFLAQLRERQEAVATATLRAEAAQKQAQAAQAQAAQSVAALGSAADAARQRLEGLSTATRAFSAPGVQFKRAVDDATTAVQRFNVAAPSMGRQVQETAVAMQRFSVAAPSMPRALKATGDEAHNSAEALQSLFFVFNGAAGHVAGINQSFSDLAANVLRSRIGLSATVAGLVGFTAAVEIFHLLHGAAEDANKEIAESGKRIADLRTAASSPILFDIDVTQARKNLEDLEKNFARFSAIAGGLRALPGAALLGNVVQNELAAPTLREASRVAGGLQEAPSTAIRREAQDLASLISAQAESNTQRLRAVSIIQIERQEAERLTKVQGGTEAQRSERAHQAAEALQTAKQLQDAIDGLTKQDRTRAEAMATYVAGLARQVAGEQAAVAALQEHGAASATAAQAAERARAVAEALTHVTGTYRDQVVALVNAQYDAKEMAAALTAEQKAQEEQFTRVAAAAAKLAPTLAQATAHFRELQAPAASTATSAAGIIDQVQAAQRKAQEEQAKTQRSAVETAQKIQENFLRSLQETVGRGFADIFEHGLAGARDFWDAFKRLALETFGQIASAAVLRQLAGTALGGALGIAGAATPVASAAGQSGGTLSRTFQIGVTGASQAVPVAASANIAGGTAGAAGAGALIPVIGGLVVLGGVVAGLIGAHKAAKEAAEQMAQAEKAYAADLDAFHRASFGLTNALGDALDAIERQADALRKQADDLYQGQQGIVERENAYLQIQASAAAAQEHARQEFVRQAADFQTEQQARLLAAGGQTDAAADLRRRAQYGDEMHDAVEKFGEGVRVFVQAAQDAEEAQIQADRANQRALSRQGFGDQVAGLAAQATGDTRTSFVLGVTQSAAQTARDWQTLYNQGVIGIEELTSALGLLNTVTQQQIDQYDAQVRQQHDDALTDARARTLAAQGRTAEADAIRLSIQYERELEDARKQGADVLAAVTAAQQAETDARAQALAIQARTDRAGVLGTIATLEGRDRDAYWLQQREQADQQLDAARRLEAAGTITADEFERLRAGLEAGLTPAAKAAADALDALQRHLSALSTASSEAQNYFKYTGATPQDQAGYYANLYGFSGMSRDQVIAGLHAPSANADQPLSADDAAYNQRAYGYLGILDQLVPTLASVADALGGGTSVSGTHVAAAASFFQGATSGQIDRYGDIAETQLAVLRDIEQNTRLFGAALGGNVSLAPVGGGTLRIEIALRNETPDTLTIDDAAATKLLDKLAGALTPYDQFTGAMQRNLTARATGRSYRRGSSQIT